MTTRRVLGGAALMACMVLVTGSRHAAAEEKKDEPVDKATAAVNAVAAANVLIEYGIAKNKPLAIIAGVELLWDNPAEADDKNLTVEGAGKDKAPDEKEQLLKLLKFAEGQVKGNEAVAKAAGVVRSRIEEGTRGTANGSTKWEGIVLPVTDKKANTPVTTLKRTFIAGKPGTITISREFNDAIPLNMKLFDPSGKEVPPRATNRYQYEFAVPKGKDAVYKLEIRNFHSKGVLVKVVTN